MFKLAGFGGSEKRTFSPNDYNTIDVSNNRPPLDERRFAVLNFGIELLNGNDRRFSLIIWKLGLSERLQK